MVKRILVLVAMLTLVSACAPAASSGDPVTVTDAWVRTTDGAADATATGAFMTLANSTGADISVKRVTSPAAGRVELHEVVTLDGKQVMREAEGGLVIPAKGELKLAPGGQHIMLMDLHAAVAAGDEITLTLTFSDDTTVTVVAPVKQGPEEDGEYHDHSTGSSSPAPTPTVAPSRTIAITLSGDKVDPSGDRVEIAKGDTVEFVVTSDRDDLVHIHGYEVTIEVKAGETVRRAVTLDQTGRFEVETHHPELLSVVLIVR